MSTALDLYEAALRRADAGHRIALTLRDDRGRTHPIDVGAWLGAGRPGDGALLDRCVGATLDVGCGPGRLVGALNRRGCPALGIDISVAAVSLARRRGATALRRDVFEPLPGHGRWRHILLADGNIGIGGAPHRLLRRCRDLMAVDGRLHLEVAGPGSRSWTGSAILRNADGVTSTPFGWATVAASDLPAMADAGALRILEYWTEANRWFASLAHA